MTPRSPSFAAAFGAWRANAAPILGLGLALVLFLVVIGLFVVRELAAKAAIEDCLLANHPNCDALLITSR